MSDPSPYRPAPADPPVASREPDWTTGQGIGFLVALPGWIIVGLAALTSVIGIGVAASDSGEGVGAVVGIAILTAVFGTIVAIPGTIVFNKCKRR